MSMVSSEVARTDNARITVPSTKVASYHGFQARRTLAATSFGTRQSQAAHGGNARCLATRAHARLTSLAHLDSYSLAAFTRQKIFESILIPTAPDITLRRPFLRFSPHSFCAFATQLQ